MFEASHFEASAVNNVSCLCSCSCPLSSFAARQGQPLPFPEHHHAGRYGAANIHAGATEVPSSSSQVPTYTEHVTRAAAQQVFEALRSRGLIREPALGEDLPAPPRAHMKRPSSAAEVDPLFHATSETLETRGSQRARIKRSQC
jgi:hypothetical protein